MTERVGQPDEDIASFIDDSEYERNLAFLAGQSIQTTAMAIRSCLPDAELPDPPAVVMLEDIDFAHVRRLTAGTSRAAPDSAYLAGLNTVVIPHLLADNARGWKDERLAARLTLAKVFIQAFTTLPASQAASAPPYRTNSVAQESGSVKLLVPGGAYTSDAPHLVSILEGFAVASSAQPRRQWLTETVTRLAAHLLLEDITGEQGYPYILFAAPSPHKLMVLAPKSSSLKQQVVSALYRGDEKQLGVSMPAARLDGWGRMDIGPENLRTLLNHPNVMIYSLQNADASSNLVPRAFSYAELG